MICQFNIVGEGPNQFKWEKVSPSGKAPGLLKNISLAEADGMIYVFGTNSEKISVLWKYNTRKNILKREE